MIELATNIGRAAIRNRLANSAKFDYLLFLDCDSGVVSREFIACYVEAIKPGHVICGGRVYHPTPPINQSKLLHWKFGKVREQIPASLRNRKPWNSFMSNNFLVPKQVFNSIGFDERLRQYGHEDTRFGWQLKAMRIPVFHIENPLEHLGLEDSGTFLRQSKAALQNLKHLTEFEPRLETRLLNHFRVIANFHLTGVFAFIFKHFSRLMERNLHSRAPSLKVFDLYKLCYFASINQ